MKNNNINCLVDFFSEEIPANMQIHIENELKKTFAKEIKNHFLKINDIQVFSSPRHFTVFLNHLQLVQRDQNLEIKGPRIDARREAIDGFLKTNKIQFKKLKIIKNKKGEFYFYNKSIKGKNIYDLINDIVNKVCFSIGWPKSQRWGHSDFKWGRPLRGILVLIGNKKANGSVKISKNDSLKFNNFTYGHRSVEKKIYIKSPEEFISTMKENYVYIKRSERKKIIVKEIKNLEKKYSLQLCVDEDLLNEVIGLVEYPNVLIGNIEKEFMKLPFEILSTVMKVHQKYFSLMDKKGKMAPFFLVVTNSPKDKINDKIILQGNERVLRARLSDALFFWETDIKTNFSLYLNKLKSMVFYENLGSLHDRSLRISFICKRLGPHFSIKNNKDLMNLGLYSKLDLCSNLVFEFPELQGKMLKYLAKYQNYPIDLQKAFEDQYKPQGLNKEMPKNNLGCILSISNNIDTLSNFFSINLQPTGSRDPLGLRRAANSLINLLWHKCDNLSFNNLLNLINKNNFKSFDVIKDKLIQFLIERLRYFLLDQGFQLDRILSLILINNFEDKPFSWIKYNIVSLEKFLKSENGIIFVLNFKRIENIIKKTEFSNSQRKINISKLEQKEEINLYKFYIELNNNIENEKLDKVDNLFLKTAKEFNLLNNNFFNKILVNDPDIVLKNNRHILLNSIKRNFNSICKFELINS